ncbi:MAG: hypothetical protein E6Q97_09530 [Desulfurellales bacterium]|nr:MAG: hypothetical protein E6Q97_09530 [Desulfurellales bacterium]
MITAAPDARALREHNEEGRFVPSDHSGHDVPNGATDRKAKRLRAILRAPELVQDLYKAGLIAQPVAITLHSSGPGWWPRLVVAQAGGPGWWPRLVAQAGGGPGWWWPRLVAQAGGPGWWPGQSSSSCRLALSRMKRCSLESPRPIVGDSFRGHSSAAGGGQ